MNGYVSFKKVTTPPADSSVLLDGSTPSSWRWALAIGNESYPHLYLMTWAPDEDLGAPPATLGISIDRLTSSLIGGFASDTDAWEPLRQAEDSENGWELWGNSQVSVSVFRDEPGVAMRLSYHRRDRAPIRDWRIGQRIKNEIAGPEWEAVELYPAESRLLDEANEYHLWCTAAPWPLGQTVRSVLTQADLDAEGLPAVQRDPEETLALPQEGV